MLEGRAVLLAALLCGACTPRLPELASSQPEAGTPVRGGTLRVVGLSDVDHLASTSAYTSASLRLMRLMTRQLVSYAPARDYASSVQVVPDLATALPTEANGGISADGRTYTFKLRPDVRWNTQPERPVTAHDVVRAFKLFCNPVAPVGAPGYYTSTVLGMAAYCDAFVKVPATVQAIREFVASHEIEGVQAPDEATVVFRLVAPAPDFLQLLAVTFASPVPEEYLRYLPDSPEFRQNTLSIGPYAITRYAQNREILFERNPAWQAQADPLRSAWVDRIHIKLGVDDALAGLQVEAGSADVPFDTGPPTAVFARYLSAGDSRVSILPDGDNAMGFQWLSINHIGPNAALRDRRVRQALALAVNKRSLVQADGGRAVSQPLYQPVMPGLSGNLPGADRWVTPADEGDPAAARRLLAEAGHAAGIRLRLAHENTGVWTRRAQAVQASLARAGFEIELVPYSGGDFYGRLIANATFARRGEWELAYVSWFPDWYGPNSGRTVLHTVFYGKVAGDFSSNHGRYDSPAANAAIERALVARSTAAADAAWNATADQIMDDVAVVPLVSQKWARFQAKRVRNCVWQVTSSHCDLTELWLADGARTAP